MTPRRRSTAVGLRFPRVLPARVAVRIGGAIEVVIGVAALLVGGPVLCALVAASYLAFAGFVVVALRTGAPISSCGCFGKVDTPPSVVHVVLDLRSPVSRPRPRSPAMSRCPTCSATSRWLGIPFLMLLAIGCSLVFLAFSSLPKTMAAVREVAA